MKNVARIRAVRTGRDAKAATERVQKLNNTTDLGYVVEG
jgi:hypothetical protein